MEATVWTEHIQTPQKLDFMIWPRLLGVIERSWHKAAWERNVTITEQLIGREADWKRFADIIGTKELRSAMTALTPCRAGPFAAQ